MILKETNNIMEKRGQVTHFAFANKRVENRMNKRGQVTLFIIIGILIVAIILMFFLWISPTYLGESSKRLGFEGCVEDALELTIEELGVNAGFPNPEFAYSYLGDKIAYLCYTNEFYITCTIQKPFLVQHFEEGISKSLRDEINACYLASINDLKERGYEVVSGEVNYEVSLEPSVARVLIDAPTTVGANKFARFNVKLNSPIYDMIMISTSILQFESELGDSDVTSLMFLHPEVIIDKLKQGDGTTIYIVTSKDYGIEFKFASRSLAWPAGYDI